jgi:hypothetical protein
MSGERDARGSRERGSRHFTVVAWKRRTACALNHPGIVTNSDPSPTSRLTPSGLAAATTFSTLMAT